MRRSERLVRAVTEGEIEGKCLSSRTAWIDDARRWTVGGLSAARRVKAGADQRQCPSQWPHNAVGEGCSSGVLVNIPEHLTSLAVGKIIQRV